MSRDDDIDLSEINRLAVDLTHASRAIGSKTVQVVRKSAIDVEAQAKQFAPVDTGALRNSIGHDIHGAAFGNDIAAEIGPTVEYGAYVEFGTSTQAPQAYMGPALDRVSPDFVAALEQLAGDVL